MSRNEKTSARVGAEAGRALNDPKASKREKSIAGSALTQLADRKPKKSKRKAKRRR